MANPARGLRKREKKKKEKVWQRPPPPPPRSALLVRRKKKKKITRRILMSRRYAGLRYAASGLGPSRVRTRMPTTRQLGQNNVVSVQNNGGRLSDTILLT